MHQVDNNDLQYVKERGYNPKAFVVAPLNAIGEIQPTVTQFFLGGNRYLTVFHSKIVYYETKEGYWRPLSEICEHHGNTEIVIKYEHLDKVHPQFLSWLIKRQAVMPNGKLLITSPYQVDKKFLLTDQLGIAGAAHISFTVLTAYPDPGSGGSVNVDGKVSGTATSTWPLACQSNGSAVDMTNPSEEFMRVRNVANATGRSANRFLCVFDTSSIGSGATINSATQSHYGFSIVNGGRSGVRLVFGTLANTNAIVNADFQGNYNNRTAISANEYYSTGANLFNNGGYNDFVYNATGLAGINLTGKTTVMARAIDDINETTIVSGNSSLGAYSADQTGTSQDPKLAVDYTAGAGANTTNFFAYF